MLPTKADAADSYHESTLNRRSRELDNMALPRESAFLPTIKCSTCGRQIEISMMGDHVCSEADAESRSSPRILDRHVARLLM